MRAAKQAQLLFQANIISQSRVFGCTTCTVTTLHAIQKYSTRSNFAVMRACFREHRAPTVIAHLGTRCIALTHGEHQKQACSAHPVEQQKHDHEWMYRYFTSKIQKRQSIKYTVKSQLVIHLISKRNYFECGRISYKANNENNDKNYDHASVKARSPSI